MMKMLLLLTLVAATCLAMDPETFPVDAPGDEWDGGHHCEDGACELEQCPPALARVCYQYIQGKLTL